MAPVVRLSGAEGLALREDAEIFLGADAQSSEVAFDLEHRQIFLGADNHGPNQVVAIPHPMITFLADEATPNREEELLESLVVDRTKSSHGLAGNGDLNGFALLPDDPRRIPCMPDLLPPILPQDCLPGIFLGYLFDE